MPHHSTRAVDLAPGTAGPSVDVAGERLRVHTPRFATPWLPDTPSTRHLTLVWCRLLVDAQGQPLCTWPELATLVGRPNRQAASQHREDVRQCGEAMRAFVRRQRKVDTTVVEGVWPEVRQTPLAGPTELAPRVQARLGRRDVRAANIEAAGEQIACVPGLRVRRRQLEAGQGHDAEAWRLTELLESCSPPASRDASHGVPSRERGMRLADPTGLTAVVTPDLPLAEVPGSRCGRTFRRTLCYWHVPRSVWGRWCGVHKTTIFRGVCGLAVAVWPLVAQGMGERVKATMVDVAETWLKLRGRGHYGCVVVDVATEVPVLAARLPSRGPWACRWLGRQLRLRRQVPKVIITDGLPA